MRIYRRAGSWYMDINIDGRRVRKIIQGARTRTEALSALTAVQADVFRGAYKIKEVGTNRFFEDMASEYLEVKAEKRSLKRDRISFKNILPAFQHKALRQISSAEIEAYKAKRLRDGVAGATVNRELSLLKHLFNIAIKKNYLDKNPVKDVAFCRETSWRHKYVLSGEEIRRLIEASAPHLRPILIVAFGTGLRKGDILNLRWANIDFGSHAISVTMQKTEDLIEIPMLPIVEDTLRGMKVAAETGSNDGTPASLYVFVSIRPSRRKKEFTKIVDVKTAFRAALRRAGLADKGYRFHDIRRTFASTLANAGIALPKVQRLLGHRSITTTERYLNVKLEEKRQAVMVLNSIWGQSVGLSRAIGTNVIQAATEEAASHLLPERSDGDLLPS